MDHIMEYLVSNLVLNTGVYQMKLVWVFYTLNTVQSRLQWTHKPVLQEEHFALMKGYAHDISCNSQFPFHCHVCPN